MTKQMQFMSKTVFNKTANMHFVCLCKCLKKAQIFSLLSSVYLYLFSNCRNLAIVQHKKSNHQKFTSKVKTFWHQLYVLVICSMTFRLLLAAFAAHIFDKKEYFKNNPYPFWWDPLINVLFSSVSSFQNATMLLCMSLMAVIALTLDRLISTKFNCLYFCQSYDLLVVNSANVISNNNHLVPPALFNVKFKNWQPLVREIFQVLRSIWNGRQLLKFSSKNLPHFDRSTCTKAVRGRAFLLGQFCEVLASWHFAGSSR